MDAMFGWITVGLAVGLLGKFIMPGRDPGGLVVTALLGIAGAILAGLAGQAAGFYTQGQVVSLVGAAIGAILLLLFYRFVMKTRY